MSLAPDPVSHHPPFPATDDEDAWHRWRDWKLSRLPESVNDLLVEIGNPLKPTRTECLALHDRLERWNMAVFACNPRVFDKEGLRAMAGHFGLRRLDSNWLADDDGITSLRVRDGELRGEFIPYTNRAIRWHTDGYYNPMDRQIHALLLYCESPAAHGGENGLFDHELAWLYLREEAPELANALAQRDVLTIPARHEDGRIARRDITGPVFSISPSGRLHMRYTLRARNVIWKPDPEVQAARERLETLLRSQPAGMVHGRLEAGMGLICRNVLHERAAFVNAPGHERLLYRARYHDEILEPA